MVFDSGLKVYTEKNTILTIPTGDITLNKLLMGGFRHDLLYLIYGEKKIINNILLKTAINTQLILNNQHNNRDEYINQRNQDKNRIQIYNQIRNQINDSVKIAYVDGNNHFNPYKISNYASSMRLNPRKVLENILISRVFTWDKMVEVLENRIIELDEVKAVLVSGITTLFKYELKEFGELWKAINGLKQMLGKLKPLIVLSAPQNKYSDFKPQGGQVITHFGNALILISENARKIEYSLIQHPSMPERTLTKVKPYDSRRRKPKSVKNRTLDEWIK